MKPFTVDSDLYRRNRQRFAREMLADSVAVFLSNDLPSSNGAGRHRFRQNPDLYYLTGVRQPETALLVAPESDERGYTEILFVRRPDHRANRFGGTGLDAATASEISKITHVRFLDELAGVLHEFMAQSGRIYVNTREDRHAYSEAPAPDLRFAERLRKSYPAHKYHRAQPILRKIGMSKTPVEVGLLREAIQLSVAGIEAAAAQIAPGRAEFEVEAAALSAVVGGGAHDLAHPVRVASGEHGLHPEYDANAETIAEGDAVQVQVGVVFAGYHASLARVVPASLEFSERQRQVYQQLAALHEASIKALVPGQTLPECEREMRTQVVAALQSLGVKNPQPTTHYSARCYHHVGRYLYDPYIARVPLQNGMTITCEPAIYLPKEGIGFQLRSVALVTDEGPLDLTTDLPTALEEVEQSTATLA